jgi:uncharacterized phage protein gp47/JayE
MPASFFPTSRSEIERRVKELMRAQEDGQGQPLFPNLDTPGSPGYNMLQLWTRLFERAYQQMNAAVNSFSPMEASGSDLDEWAQFFGMSRKGAAPGNGQVLLRSEVTGSALQRLQDTRRVPSGTRVRVGSAVLETTGAASIPKNEKTAEAPVESVRASGEVVAEAGSQGSLGGQAVLSDLVSAELLTDVSGGRRAETDEQLRFRLVRALRAPSTPEGLRAQILSNSDVADVSIEEGTYGPGTAEAFVEPAVAFPPEDLREQIESDVEGPSKIYVTLPAYEGLSLKVRATSIPENGDARVANYVNNLATGDTLIINEIEDRVREAGAEDAQVIAIKRGTVSSDQSELIDPTRIEQITNLTPQNSRTRFYTQRQWITLCN